MAKGGGICVANHTSPIDAILLACGRNYALVGFYNRCFLTLISFVISLMSFFYINSA